MSKYHKKTWLTEESSTAAVVAFHGEALWGYYNERAFDTFLEISDCHVKARLHRSKFETHDHFVKKIKLLRDEISEFVLFLESVSRNETANAEELTVEIEEMEE